MVALLPGALRSVGRLVPGLTSPLVGVALRPLEGLLLLRLVASMRFLLSLLELAMLFLTCGVEGKLLDPLGRPAVCCKGAICVPRVEWSTGLLWIAIAWLLVSSRLFCFRIGLPAALDIITAISKPLVKSRAI